VNVRIRPEAAADAPAIAAVTLAAFANAPHTTHTQQFIVSALRTAGALTVSLVADADRYPTGPAAGTG
jgi:putative acetyltransferase